MELQENQKQQTIISASQIWEKWTDMWNGELSKADKIIETGFCLNLTSNKFVKQETISDASKVKEFVQRVRDKFKTIHYENLSGPYVDTDQNTICCHWKATGIFSGASDYPTDIAGNTFLIEGTDILKFKEGKIYECWTQSNLITKE